MDQLKCELNSEYIICRDYLYELFRYAYGNKDLLERNQSTYANLVKTKNSIYDEVAEAWKTKLYTMETKYKNGTSSELSTVKTEEFDEETLRMDLRILKDLKTSIKEMSRWAKIDYMYLANTMDEKCDTPIGHMRGIVKSDSCMQLNDNSNDIRPKHVPVKQEKNDTISENNKRKRRSDEVKDEIRKAPRLIIRKLNSGTSEIYQTTLIDEPDTGTRD